jgi:hypothetical protein
VRARGISVYLLVFMGAQAVGAVLWGLLASHTSLATALTVSAVLLGLAAASVRVLGLHARTTHLDRTVVTDWPTPTLAFEPSPSDGPVVVTVSYRVRPADVPAFVAASAKLELARRRTGARRWRLYRDGADGDRYIESFTVRSWSEHLRQHDERWTGYEREVLGDVRSLSVEEPSVEHLFPQDVPRSAAADELTTTGDLNDDRT